MFEKRIEKIAIAVVGLGYVGLPLAVEFGKSRKFRKVIGYDTNAGKIASLNMMNDPTGELSADDIKLSNVFFTSDEKYLSGADFIAICVPTPISDKKLPVTKYLESASLAVAKNMKKGAIVVYESTVYPGLTESICLPILEKHSGFKLNRDFKLGYSPERINPGDKKHTLANVKKIVSASDSEGLSIIYDVYSAIVKAGVFKAKSIMVAEAAKVIENIQRDLNIALMNELSLIFERLGIQTKDVIEAASTKWNFHSYYPGLVGGHCIGVDPYYLTYRAKQLGYDPKVILAGRDINEYMPKHIAELTLKSLASLGKLQNSTGKPKVLILGLTFKENVKDSRNSKVVDIINELKKSNIDVVAYDPMVSPETAEKVFGVANIPFSKIKKADAVILATAHNSFKGITLDSLAGIMEKPVLIDARSFFDKEEAIKKGFIYKSL